MNKGNGLKHYNNRALLLGLLLLAPLSASSAPKGDDAKPSGGKGVVMSAESTAAEVASGDGLVQTVSNTSFMFTTLYNPKKQGYADSVLLAQKIESTQRTGREGANARLETVAWLGHKGKYETKLWTINDCADTAWRSGDFYLTSKYGVGGGENMLRAYNFASGDYVFSYTTEPVQSDIYIPKEVLKRHFAYVAKSGADSECRANELPKGSVGMLALSDGAIQLDRISLDADGDDWGRSPRLALIDKKETKGTSLLSVWGPAEFTSKSEVVKGFSLKVVYQDGSEVVIPIANDKFDLEHAVKPAALKLRRIDVEKSK